MEGPRKQRLEREKLTSKKSSERGVESTGRERTASVEKNVQQWQKYRRRGR